MKVSKELLEALKRQEGFRSEPYLCPTGHVTIGYGHNLEADPSPLRSLTGPEGTWNGEQLAARIMRRDVGGRVLLELLTGAGLHWSEAEAAEWLEKDVLAVMDTLGRLCPAYRHLSNLEAAAHAGRSEGAGGNAEADHAQARAEVLINMAFNMGVPGLLKFRRTLDAVRADDYDAAASHMLDSRWACQVGRRAVELARQMRAGVRGKVR